MGSSSSSVGWMYSAYAGTPQHFDNMTNMTNMTTQLAGVTHLKPQDSSEVQVVGGLVQQQHCGLDVQRARQGYAHAPAAREVSRGPPLHGFCEAQAVQDLRGARLGAVGTDFLRRACSRSPSIVRGSFCDRAVKQD